MGGMRRIGWLAGWLAVGVQVGLASEWVTVRGRIVYDGTPPVPKRIVVAADIEFCGQQELYDESLLVHPENRGLQNVIVQLVLGRGEKIDVHDSYPADAAAEVALETEKCQFQPRVVTMRTTQTLVVANPDPIGDNVKIDVIRNAPINITLPAGGEHRQKFPEPERLPARVSCTIHPWEVAWLVITDHPYVAVTDKDGNFEIRNVPVGKRRLMFWHEKSAYVTQVTLQGRPETWQRGTREWELEPGTVDLGEIVVAAKLFGG